MTYSLAHASAWETGERSRKAAGRTAWNEEDYNAAMREFDRLMPDPQPVETEEEEPERWDGIFA